MTRELPAGVAEAMEADLLRVSFAVELNFDGDETLRMWTGIGELTDTNGDTWFGTGNILSIDDVEETSEIVSSGATLTLSSVPSEVLSLALSEPYQGREGKIYLMLNMTDGPITRDLRTPLDLFKGGEGGMWVDFGPLVDDDNYGLIQFVEIFSGYMDTMPIEESPETSTVALSLENKLITLEREPSSRYSSEWQKSIHPSDKGLDFVADLQNRETLWGRTISN